MAKVKHYLLDEITEDDFSIIAFHSSYEGYLLAFHLNTHCGCQFVKSKKKKQDHQSEHPFESFEWIDSIKGIEVRFFSNKYKIMQNDDQKGTSLFDLPETKELYLVQELKDADYIIKINSGIEVQFLIEQMESIDEISYRFIPDKSQLNLDFSINID